MSIKLSTETGIITIFDSTDVIEDLRYLVKALSATEAGRGILGTIQVLHDAGLLDKNDALRKMKERK